MSEFEQALGAFGLFPKKVELQALMKFYDVNGDGNVSYDEFLSGLRDALNQRRQDMVNKCFTIMDRDGSGQITVSDIANTYDVSMHKEFIEGRKTKQQILEEFLNNFDGAHGNNDGVVTKGEWNDYYTDLSMGIPNDDYFVQMLESVWNIPEKQDANFNEKLKWLLTEVRTRVLALINNITSDDMLKKVFKDFDTNKSNSLTVDELGRMMAKLKLSVERKYLHPFFKVLDPQNKGAIEFEDWKNYLLGH